MVKEIVEYQYHCDLCGKKFWRAYKGMWFKSMCDKNGGKLVRVYRTKLKRIIKGK